MDASAVRPIRSLATGAVSQPPCFAKTRYLAKSSSCTVVQFAVNADPPSFGRSYKEIPSTGVSVLDQSYTNRTSNEPLLGE